MTGLLSALRLFDPNEAETRIFQAALNNGDAAFEALQSWDIVDYLAGRGKWMRGQLPLIYHNLSDQLSVTPLHCRPYLKTATLRERKRYDMYLACLRDALTALNATDRAFCVVKGAAAANTVYPDPFLRHCHDVDAVVAPADLAHFVQALRASGFAPSNEHLVDKTSTRLDHPVGLPVVLHTRPIEQDPRFSSTWMMEEARRIETPAGSMPVPARARRILHAWLHRFLPDRFDRHAWVPDTVLDLRACTTEDIAELNAQLNAYPHLSEALASARYLARHFDGLPQLDQLLWSAPTLAGQVTASQRARYRKRAQAQGVLPQFTGQLNTALRAQFTYDWVVPPAAHFDAAPGDGLTRLWRKRVTRLLHGGRRRMQRLVLK